MLLHVTILLFLLIPSLAVDLTYTVSEGTLPDTYIGDVATDAGVLTNLSSNDASLFRFIQLTPEFTNNSRLFRLTKKDGRLYTYGEIDAETICQIHIQCYKIIDIAVHRQASFIKLLEVKIIIQDVNDHTPEFPLREMSIVFSERDSEGMQLLIPSAVDKDVGLRNSMISYKLRKGEDEPFKLRVLKRVDGKAKLSICLERSLDREMTDSYLLQVVAQDMGSPIRENVLNIKITVKDENDNLPTFSQNVYNVSIGKLHQRSNPVIVLTAEDLDSDDNGKVNYKFSSDTSNVTKSHFELNEETGEIFLKQDLPQSSKGPFKLYVEAEDKGDPPLSSIAMILVNMAREENHPPNIDINVVSENEDEGVGISEDTKVGSFVAYMKVTDFDEGHDGKVICDLRHNKFQLERLETKKYKIVLKNPLDREAKITHNLIIECKDQGTPSLRSEKTFSIQVLDVNDEQPQFSAETFQFFVAENEKSGVSVGFINVSDLDLGTGGQLSFSLLTSSEEFLPFKISQNGLISINASLDREFQNVYKFQVFVKDHGTPSLNNTADVIVEIKDRNDNAPYFTFPNESLYIMNITYYPENTNNIIHIEATDDDIEENALLRYRIMKGNIKDLFAIDHYSGLLSFNRVVEKYDAGLYELEVVVKDSGVPVLLSTTRLSLFLSVSNSKISNENESDIMIHFNVAIVIVVASVTLAISTVLILTICYIRYSDKKITKLKQLNKLGIDSPNCTDNIPIEITLENSSQFSPEKNTFTSHTR